MLTLLRRFAEYALLSVDAVVEYVDHPGLHMLPCLEVFSHERVKDNRSLWLFVRQLL